MTSSSDSKVLQYSAMQLAWLHELGIDKPWLPGEVRATAPASQNEPAPKLKRQELKRQELKGQEVTQPTVVSTVAVSDLESLAQAASACQACGLCSHREQVVMGQGVMQPAILVIGDGPGEQDDRKGLPFMAESGALLDQMLVTIGSARTRDVYLTNLVKCRPPGNRLALPEEIAACRPFLLRQIELVRPFSILALGRVVAQSLLNTNEPLQNLRGRVHELEVAGQKIPLVASYHSGYLLNHPADKAAAWQDLQLLRSVHR